MPTSADPPAASLVGALGVFSVPDVLRLVAGGRHRGELLVVANGLDGRLWLQDGALTGAAVRGTGSLAQAVFELALLEEGWFYFTAGRTAPEPAETPHPVEDVLHVVLPQVVEWRDLLHRVPLDAVVTLAPTPPQGDVQLSAAQWQVLATVGGRGTRVIDVVAATGRDQVQTVRTLRDMADAGLVAITGGTPQQQRPVAHGPLPPPPASASTASTATAPAATAPAATGPTATVLAAATPAAVAATPPVASIPASAVPGPEPAASAPADGADADLVPMAMAGPRPPARTVASDPPLPPLPRDGEHAEDAVLAEMDAAGA